MALTTSNLAECELLDKLLKDALVTNENYILKLYKNDYTPDDDYVAASFTEADFTNYVAHTLTRSGWNAATVVSNKANSQYSSVQTWTCGSSGNQLFGYYVVASTSNVVLWAERFAASRTLADQDVFSLQPSFDLNHS